MVRVERRCADEVRDSTSSLNPDHKIDDILHWFVMGLWLRWREGCTSNLIVKNSFASMQLKTSLNSALRRANQASCTSNRYNMEPRSQESGDGSNKRNHENAGKEIVKSVGILF